MSVILLLLMRWRAGRRAENKDAEVLQDDGVPVSLATRRKGQRPI